MAKKVSKVVYNSNVLIDLTADTVAADKLLSGITAHGADGNEVTGSITQKAAATYTPGTADQTIASGQYLSGAQTISGDANLVAANIKSGTALFGVTGTFTDDADATASEILSTKTGYVGGAKVTGTMPNIGAQTGTITTKAQEVTISQGYHDGSGKVSIDADEQAKIIPGNILMGKTILGVTGTVEPSSEVKIEANKDVTPAATQQVVSPSSGFDALAQVTVAAVPYTETDNAAGGLTVTIL